LCSQVRSLERTRGVPILMIAEAEDNARLLRGLEAGADDFLTKPVSDIALLARVRSLVRLKMAADELRMRAVTSREIGINDPEFAAVNETGMKGRVLLVDDKRGSYERLAGILTAEHTVDVESNPQEALFHAAEADYECMIVSLGLNGFDGLRLCSQVRSLERTRGVPILMIAEAEDNARLLRGLEIGVNDYLVRPVDKNELLARVRTQIRRRRYTVRLRDNVQQSMEMAITDGLTGLYNRRYMESHLSTLVEQAAARGKPLSLLVLDIDYFKSINDTHGHDAGDDVLREFAVRVKKSIRGIDLACRYGGEEFVIVMPETDMAVAALVAERIRRRIAGEPFAIEQGAKAIDVTLSIGLAGLGSNTDTGATILKRADQALYRAKRDGRNRVVADAA
ncbi:MAG TPA: PleD family two-component system response regulator, partial [Xanthobacteraceae bacterium]|nr:PleD family two-component system response regulator [Xanthobacteraceae bacterium]